MQYPNFNEEKKLWRRGYKFVAGLDEAGRGCLAGPVVAAVVIIKIFNFQFSIFNFKKLKSVKDSKKLTAKKREEFYKILTNCPDIKWGIGRVSEKIIDKINILEATKLAMKKAIKNLEEKINKKPAVQKSRDREISAQLSSAGFLVLDGNFTINLPLPQKSIIKADEKVFSCAVASILAKVTRDRIMLKYDKKYPQYGFKKHKGYPTKLHLVKLKKYGVCEIHRKSFAPIIKILNQSTKHRSTQLFEYSVLRCSAEH